MIERKSLIADQGIRKLRSQDIEHVVGIYVDEFPNNRSTRLGRRFLKKMFAWFIGNPCAMSFVAVSGSKVVGFIIGFEGGGYGSKLFKALWPTILRESMVRPALLFRLDSYRSWMVFLQRLFMGQDEVGYTTGERVGIASLAVRDDYKRRGVGSALLDALEAEALSRGYAVFSASTKSSNFPAINFYRKRGFEVRRSDDYIGFVKRF